MKNLISAATIGVSVTSLLLSGFIAPAYATTDTTITAETATSQYDTQKAELLQRINAYRAENSLKPVSLNANIGTVAQNWSDKTASSGEFKHNPNFSTQIPSGWQYAAEIIAADDSPEGMMLGWKFSESHNNILLEPKATEIGLGYAYQGNPAGEYYGNYYSTAILADYTAPAPAPTPVSQTVTAQEPLWGTTDYSIPSVTGVQYKVNGEVKATGVYPAESLVTVTAEAKEGYTLSGTASWTHDYTPVTTEPVPTEQNVTAPAPTFTATTYTIPSSTQVQYSLNGTVKTAGTYTGSGTVTITATGLEGYTVNGTSSWSNTFVPAPVIKPSIKNPGDIVALDSAGTLWNYGNLKVARTAIGTGMKSTIDIHTADWNKDGYTDVIAKNTLGELHLYKALSTGGFTKTRIGTGWQNYTIDIVTWDKRIKYPSIIAMNKINGNLYNYMNAKGTGITGVALIGSGWQKLDINALDWDKDGNIDFIVKNSSGQLLLYRTNGTGKFVSEKRTIIGSGWHIFNSISVVKNLGGSGTTGLLARNASTGQLVYYQANKSSWSAGKAVSNGWNTYRIANQ